MTSYAAHFMGVITTASRSMKLEKSMSLFLHAWPLNGSSFSFLYHDADMHMVSRQISILLVLDLNQHPLIWS